MDPAGTDPRILDDQYAQELAGDSLQAETTLYRPAPIRYSAVDHLPQHQPLHPCASVPSRRHSPLGNSAPRTQAFSANFYRVVANSPDKQLQLPEDDEPCT